MRSHEYQFRLVELRQVLGLPLVVVVGLVFVMHLADFTGLLPDPRPLLDMDRTILFHQASAARTPQKADLLLLGDSSCLMDVSAPALGRLADRSALNLGTLSYVDLAADAALLRAYAAANPGRLRTVVLLLHPTTLRLGQQSGYHSELVWRFLSRADLPGAGFESWLGLDLLRSRLLARLLPVPLPGLYGATYGFTWDLWRQLDAHSGTLTDPGRYDPLAPMGSAEFRLAGGWEGACAVLRAAVPSGVTLAVGVTPCPASFVRPETAQSCRTLLTTLGQWLRADVVLTNLPLMLPDQEFASLTHLNAQGTPQFTSTLAGLLKQK